MTGPNPQAGLITTQQFSALTGLKKRAAILALAECHKGRAWRGQALAVVTRRARGGAAGLSYLVQIDSLPPDLYLRAEELFGTKAEEDAEPRALPSPSPGTALTVQNQTPISLPTVSASKSAETQGWGWKWEIIRPALAFDKGSRQRATAIAQLAKQSFPTPAGARRQFGEATLRGWIAKYQENGIGGLDRKGRCDRGKGRVWISRKWDRYCTEAGLPEGRRKRIAAKLRKYIRDLWAGPTVFAGWRTTAEHAGLELLELTAAALNVAPWELPRGCCSVPRTIVERQGEYRSVGIYDRDRKRHEDQTRPRIRRGIENLQAMQIVMGDVHPHDIYYHRDDDSLATAKLIAWLDVATGRIKLTPHFPEKGEGVREEHVITAFIGMVTDPYWGLPGQLYLDNGSEYQWDNFISDAIRLAGMKVGLDGTSFPKAEGTTIRAKAYNASAKGVLEGAFHQLEQRFFSLVPGWIGGDRLKTKVANVGKAPAGFPGTKAELIKVIKDVEAAFNDAPQIYGRLKGQSPNERLAELVGAGWKRTDITEDALYAAFCKREDHVVRQGGISHKGRKFYDDYLAALPAGTHVSVGIPKWGERDRLAIYDERDRFRCVAVADKVYDHTDTAGAVESSRRQGISRKAIARRRAKTQPIDGCDLLARQAATAAVLPVPDRGGVVHFDPDHIAAGKALRESATDRDTRRQSEDENYRQRMGLALTKLVGNGGH